MPEHRYVEEKKRPFVYDKTKEATSFEKARHYLVEERKLSPLLVDCLHDKGFIRQDNRNNVLFCWVDKDQIVGVSEKGTVANPNYPNGSWKHIRENSSGDHGFTFSFGQPKHLKFFESSIDALSYATLHPEIKDTQLVAMEGLKDGAFKQYVEQAIQTLGQKPDSISFCVDNDTGGKNFSSKDSLHAFYEALGGDKLAHIQSEFPPKPPGLSQTTKWDWNDQLKYVTAQFSDVAYTNSWSQSEGLEL